MDRRRWLGVRTNWVKLAAVAAAVSLVLSGVTLAAFPGGGGGSRPVVLAPGSSGSLHHYSWWDPRGWFGGGGGNAPRARTVAADGGPQVGRRLHQAVAPRPHRVAEVVSKRTADTRVYRLSDGRMQADIAAGPVNYRDQQGRWRPIDTTVHRVARPGYEFGNTTNTFGSFFGSGAGRMVRFEAPGGGWLEMSLDGAHLSSPRVSGSTVGYPRVLPGTGLSYQVTPTALREDITLASPSVPASFSYTVTVGGGLVPWQRSNGQVVFSRGSAGAPPVLMFPAPFMTSAQSDRSSPYGKVWSSHVAQRMAWDASTRTLRLTLTPDAAWLDAPGRVFPVVIDPTVEVVPDSSSAQNVMIESDTPSTNYDSSWQLPVGTTATGDIRSLLSFPLTAIPSGTQIDSADLRMYYDQSFGGTEITAEAHQATAAWNASTATWSNASSNVGQLGNNQVVVDDSDTGSTSASGSWPSQADSSAIGGSYLYNQDSVSGDTFTWVPPLTESGSYQVEAHYVASPNAASAAPYTVDYSGGSHTYTVNQQSGSGGVWTTLGTQTFTAGTTGEVVLGDGPASTSTRVEADAVRLTKSASVTTPSVANAWDEYSVRNIVQSWLDNTSPNYGFVVKDANEATLNQGGVRYEASRSAYNGETANYPQLVVTYGRPSVTLNQITTINATGADLSWTPYTDPTPGSDPGDDLTEYQVHRSVGSAFTPDASTLVAPVPAGTTSYTDDSEPPTPPGQTPNAFYYMVAVKTADGQVIPGPVQLVQLPNAGFTKKIIDASGATTLSQAQPDTSEQHLSGQPWLAVGNDNPTYGVTRTVVNYPSMASVGIPATATVTDAELKLWGWYNNNVGGAAATYDVHALTQDFDPATATWNDAAAGAPWTTAGGAFSPTVTGSVTGLLGAPPGRVQWPVTSTVQGWAATPASEHGLLLQLHAESGGILEQELFLDTSAAEAALHPELVVTYTDPTPQNTYYVPSLPDPMSSATSYTVPVTLTNTTPSTWSRKQWVLSYHWLLPDGTDVSNSVNQVQTSLSADMAPGSVATVSASVTAPDTSTSGGDRTGYQLAWDLYNKSTGTWLSAGAGGEAVAPLAQPASVEQAGSDQLGLEKYYQYTGVSTGSGSALLNNAANGNVVWSYNPFSNPSRGFGTFVRISYNSMDTSDSSMGFGWSLQASTLMRLGTPLDFHPNPSPTTVTLTDGDGTSHQFTWNSKTNQWVSPPGLHYYLQQPGTCDPSGKTQNPRAWLLTRPDRTQFWFDCQGYQTAVIDNNGNEADFTYTDRSSNNKPVKFLDYITDPSGRQTLTLSYYHKGDSYSYIDSNGNVASGTNLTDPQIIDQVKSITDISGRTITFLYTTQGLMAQMTDGDGTSLAKTFKFGYDMTQGNKNVKLVSVTDPRQHTTSLAYYTAPQDPKFKWSTETITDRRQGTTNFAYTEPAPGQPTGSVQTVVTDPNTHASTYQLDSLGRPVQVTNALQQQTTLGWDSDNNVVSLKEDNGATTTWTYDPDTGYPLTMHDAEANKNGTAGTTYTYQTGLGGHVADLISKLTPQQRLWTFGYDANGNLTSVTDPDGNAPGAPAGSYTTKYAYDSLFELKTVTDADGNTTTYSDYDANGYPQAITDAMQPGNTTHYAYDSRGNVVSVTDPLNHTSTYQYDVFGRPGQSVVPKDQANGVYITTPAPVYDGNDNVTQSTAPNGAVTTYSYDNNDDLTAQYAPPNDGTTNTRETTYSYDPVGNLTSKTDPKGNVSGAPSGSYTTTYKYDDINELTSVTDAAGDLTKYGYDDAGNRTSMIDPRNNQTSYFFNFNHRPTGTKDPAGYTTSTTYDLDGLVTATTDQNNNTTKLTLDPRGDVIQQIVPPDVAGSSSVSHVTQFVYDQAGNRTQVLTPKAVAAGYSSSSGCVQTQTCPFTDVTHYDADNRQSAQLAAYDPGNGYPTRSETDYTYDPASRLASVTAPPSAGQTVDNVTKYGYWDTGWVQSATDPTGIVTSYNYNDLGQQHTRTITSADQAMSRTMTWDYYPDGSLQKLTDAGVPTGLYSEMVDNSDSQNTTASPATGVWNSHSSSPGYVGQDYATDVSGSSSDSFTWKLHIPADGKYTVYAAYPAVSNATASATYTITYSNSAGGTATASASTDQTKNTSPDANGKTVWVALGTWQFSQSQSGQTVSLAGDPNATVVADAIRVVRDNSGDQNTATNTYTYSYDPNGNQTGIAITATPTPQVTSFAMTYNGIDQLTNVEEDNAGGKVHSTTYGYDPAGNLVSRGHDAATSSYLYDNRNFLTQETDATSSTDQNPQITKFTPTPTGQVATETKANSNLVTYSYFADGMVSSQTEKTQPAGTLVDSHTYSYDPNGNKTQDISQVMNADNHSQYLSHTYGYSYDPRDEITAVTTDGAQTESYTHDANSNVTSQSITSNNTATTTNFTYSGNQVASASSNGVTDSYNYDPLGRLDTITSTASPTPLQQNTYDGFDNLTKQQQGSNSTSYSYDPLNRVTSQTVNSGTPTQYSYLGLSPDLTSESSGGTTTKSYTYTPGGQRLSQTSTSGPDPGTGYYTYNGHNDVEAVTGADGTTTSTYGYTAYGQPIASQFTGADKNAVNPSPTAQPYSSYRFNAMRWNSSTGQYDMGFRTYDPGLNQFLSRDMYNGALADMGLTTDPFTGNRYTFGAGNPISNIELDGHLLVGANGGATTPATSCGLFGLSCVRHFLSDFAGGFGGTLAGVAKGAIGFGIHQVTQQFQDFESCSKGRLLSCGFLGGLSNPLFDIRMGMQSGVGAVQGAVKTGIAIATDFTSGHAGRALGSIGAYVALILATRGAGGGSGLDATASAPEASGAAAGGGTVSAYSVRWPDGTPFYSAARSAGGTWRLTRGVPQGAGSAGAGNPATYSAALADPGGSLADVLTENEDDIAKAVTEYSGDIHHFIPGVPAVSDPVASCAVVTACLAAGVAALLWGLDGWIADAGRRWLVKPAGRWDRRDGLVAADQGG